MAAPHVKDCKLFFDESHLCHSSAFDSKLLESQEITFTVSFQEQVYLNHDGCIRAWLIVAIVLSFLSNCCCVQKVKRTFACCRGFITKNYRILSSINLSLSKPYNSAGREPWSSGHGTRLVIWGSWVQIPAPYTGWTFFHINLLQKLYGGFSEKDRK